MDGIGARIDELIDYEAARTTPPPGFPYMPEIPGGRYTRTDFEALEIEHMWRKSWVCAGRVTALAERGSYMTFEKLDVPILIVRGRDDTVRAFYNTCRHRGAPVAREAAGQVSFLRCQFHTWTYSLEGKLIAVPEEHDFICLDKSRRGLIEVRCEIWAGWIFLNEDPQAPPLLDSLGTVPQELACARMETLRTVHRASYIVDCNWKTTMDAFIEVYHLNTIHGDTAARVLEPRASTIGLMPGGHTRQSVRRRTPLGNTVAVDATTPDITTMSDPLRRLGISYNIFPNLVTPVDPIGFPVLLMWPRGPRQCEIEVYFVGPDWGDGPRPAFYDGYFAFFDQLIEEDLQNLAPIQKSLNSGAFTGALCNYQERRIYWLHEEIDRRIGVDRIPPELAVRQVLGPFVESI